MIDYKNVLRLHDQNRYKGRKILNSILGFIWSLLVLAGVLIVGAIVFVACQPWLKMLWDTISNKF